MLPNCLLLPDPVTLTAPPPIEDGLGARTCWPGCVKSLAVDMQTHRPGQLAAPGRAAAGSYLKFTYCHLALTLVANCVKKPITDSACTGVASARGRLPLDLLSGKFAHEVVAGRNPAVRARNRETAARWRPTRRCCSARASWRASARSLLSRRCRCSGRGGRAAAAAVRQRRGAAATQLLLRCNCSSFSPAAIAFLSLQHTIPALAAVQLQPAPVSPRRGGGPTVRVSAVDVAGHRMEVGERPSETYATPEEYPAHRTGNTFTAIGHVITAGKGRLAGWVRECALSLGVFPPDPCLSTPLWNGL